MLIHIEMSFPPVRSDQSELAVKVPKHHRDATLGRPSKDGIGPSKNAADTLRGFLLRKRAPGGR